MQKTLPFFCWEGVLTAQLHSNGSYSIVACVFVTAVMCLPSRCVAMNVYSDFSIPALGRHVTLFTVKAFCAIKHLVSGRYFTVFKYPACRAIAHMQLLFTILRK
jgi:hypothetical protein